VVAATLAFAIVLWGGYSHSWPWTGINGHTATLWDWLHLLLLPMAVAVLPIWITRTARLDPRIKRIALGACAVFAVIVLCGYLIPWAWTGFVGNSLWDWLNLVALPLAVALTPLAVEIREGWTTRHTALGLTCGALFTVIVVCGYLIPWAWTGFTGNTLWDWLHLLLLPLLLPIVVVPALVPRAQSRMVTVEAGDGQTGERPPLGVAAAPASSERSAATGSERSAARAPESDAAERSAPRAPGPDVKDA
jgi:hypothetical protein